MAQASIALATARTLLNDDNVTVWNDAVLMPKLREAHRELQTDLWLVGSPVVREVTNPITVTAGSTDLGSSQPNDLVSPTELYEASVGTDDWTPMTEVSFIPIAATKTDRLIYWCWRNEKIKFLGSTANRRVVVYYRKLITIPELTTDDIGIIFGELYLGARIASLAAASVGNRDAHDTFYALAKANFEKVVSANRGQQKPVMKP